MSEQTDLRLAVLIDADNAPRSALGDVMAEVAVYGTPTIKRIYGDWTTPNLASWKPILLENAITPIQQYGYTTGKNSTDSAMIIDAMDILYAGQVDGFVLVSSDSDFTRLAIRLREAGKKVYGMGERKTPNPFIVACDKLVYIEVIRAAAEQARQQEAAKVSPPPRRAPVPKRTRKKRRRNPRLQRLRLRHRSPGSPRRSWPSSPIPWRCWPTRMATPPWASWAICWSKSSGISTPATSASPNLPFWSNHSPGSRWIFVRPACPTAS